MKVGILVALLRGIDVGFTILGVHCWVLIIRGSYWGGGGLH